MDSTSSDKAPMDGEDKESDAVVIEGGAAPTSTDDENNGADDKDSGEDDERWYAADDGSYFTDRREPFFYFNFCCYAICLGLFVYFSYSIVKDFIDQQNDPPTSTKIQNDVSQSFPGIIVCNRDANVPLNVISAGFENSTSGSQPIDITNRVREIDCGNSTSVCLSLDSTLPAFDYIEAGGRQTVTSRNTIDLIVDVNADDYSNTTAFIGVNGYLHEPGKIEDIENRFCNTPVLPNLEDCPSDPADLSLDQFTVSSDIGTFIALSRSEIQYTINCDRNLVQWDPTTSTLAFNDGTFGLSITESLVVIQFQFDSALVSRTSYNPLSGQSMFGSLSGWFGFLTDGWGILSLLFFSERTALYLRDRYRK